MIFFFLSKLRFKQTSKLWGMHKYKRHLPAVHPASERMRLTLRILQEAVNRCFYNILVFCPSANEYNVKGRLVLSVVMLYNYTIVTATTDWHIHTQFVEIVTFGVWYFSQAWSLLKNYLFICKSLYEMCMVSKNWEHPWSAAKALMLQRQLSQFRGKS